MGEESCLVFKVESTTSALVEGMGGGSLVSGEYFLDSVC